MKTIESLRLKLHHNAELSGNEKKTNKILNKFLEKTNPDIHLKNIGGYGIVAIYKGIEKGKNILLRADIDGLNIPRESQQETGTGAGTGTKFKVQSQSQSQSQYSHRCGHDGHAAILCGLALRLAKKRPEKGDVILLFQPAEETGEGAMAIMQDPTFRELEIDAAYALHNLPSYAKHQIIIKDNCFASASSGLKIIFDGTTSHASQPEKGNNPQKAVMILLDAFKKKYDNLKNDINKTLLTITHVSIGEETFGVTPGHAEIWLTLRSQDNKALHKLEETTIKLCAFIANEFKLDFSYSIHEAFSATTNSRQKVDIVEQSAKELRLSINKIQVPFPWSEDFGRFGEICPCCLFGLGCGLEHEPLHSPRYEFEDEILDTGINMFEKIIELEMKK